MQETIRLNAGRCPLRYDRRRRGLVSPFLDWSRLLAGRRAPSIRAWVRSGLVPVRVRDEDVVLSPAEWIAARAVGLGFVLHHVTRRNAARTFAAALSALARVRAGFIGADLVILVPEGPPLILFGDGPTLADARRVIPGGYRFQLSRRFEELRGWLCTSDPSPRPTAAVVQFRRS